MKTSAKIFCLYSTFALLYTIINISTQMLSVALYRGAFYIELSILLGTVVGLPIRYALEKKYIFKYKTTSITHNTQIFILYLVTSIVTTLIFWLTEYTFHLVFYSAFMRYTGAVIGLTAGFIIKYKIDKRYVFKTL